MVQAELYAYDGCSSCRNAEALLRDRGATVNKREFFKDRMSAGEISALFARIGMTPKEMLATRSRPYRELGLAERSLTDDEIVELMAEHPALIRRPVLVVGDRGLAGFNRGSIEQLLTGAEKG
jgi:Spx/MgsR family transcriptional regulator